MLGCIWLCDLMDSLVRQAPLSMGFSRQEHWSEQKEKKKYLSGLPFPSLQNVVEPLSPVLADRFFTSWATGEAPRSLSWCIQIGLKCNLWYPFKSKVEGVLRDTQGKVCDLHLQEDEAGRNVATSGGTLTAPRSWKARSGLPVRDSGKRAACWHLDLKPLVSRTVREHIFIV